MIAQTVSHGHRMSQQDSQECWEPGLLNHPPSASSYLGGVKWEHTHILSGTARSRILERFRASF